jgi:regulator of sigma E protease
MSIDIQHFFTSLAAYLVGISLLVAIHEFGHFWVARRVGIKVLRFSIGFGRVLWKRLGRDGVEYAISAIPVGGYVKLLDEREGNVSPQDLPFAFGRQAVWKRILVLFAGPAFNFIFAVIAFWCVFMLGVNDIKPVIGEIKADSIVSRAGLRSSDTIVQVGSKRVSTATESLEQLLDQVIDNGSIEMHVVGADQIERTLWLEAQGKSRELTEPNALLTGLGFDFWKPTERSVIAGVAPNRPAARAGLLAGDQIVSIDGIAVEKFDELAKLIHERPDRDVMVQYVRAGNTYSVSVKIEGSVVDGRTQGLMGIQAVPEGMLVRYQRSPLQALPAAVIETANKIAFVFKSIVKLVTGHISVKSISGPIGIASVAGQVVHYGLVSILTFLALISISVGVLNLLPIPMLDGGQIVQQIVELLNRGPVSERAQVVFQQIGIVLLVLLTGLAIYNDITRHT